jgi:energy-converting hydrogenase Eha subunit C
MIKGTFLKNEPRDQIVAKGYYLCCLMAASIDLACYVFVYTIIDTIIVYFIFFPRVKEVQRLTRENLESFYVKYEDIW